MHNSPGFSRFRELMDIADLFMMETENASALKHMIDSRGLLLFFKKDGDYYGAGEDGRIVFAKLKHPDEDTPSGWEDDANFTAINLSQYVKGHPCHYVFGLRDLKKIQVVDQDEVVNSLKSEPIKKPAVSGIQFVKVLRHDRDEAPNFTRADEE